MLVRNDRYWGRRAKALVDNHPRVRLGREDSGRAGQRDIDLTELFGPSRETMDRLSALPKIELTIVPSERYERLYFNGRSPVLQVDAVRRAIALSIDRSSIAARSSVGRDAVVPNNRFFVPTESGYRDTSGGTYDRTDLPAAKKLLEDAGFRSGDDGVLARSGQRLALRMPVGGPTSELIVEQLRQLGIEVDVRSDLDPLEVLSSGDFDLMITSRPAPSNSKSSVANELLTGAAFNYGAYSNPVIDDLLQRANSEADRAVRAQLYAKADELLWTDLPTLPLQQVTSVVVRRRSLQNVKIRPSGGTFDSAQMWSEA